jgi:DNA polymerase-3 subunit epsilon
MREIILDTETTGISPAEGHRIVEIGAIELFNHVPSGKTFHVYLNPERDMPKEAEAVHGLSSAFLKDKPLFKDVATDFLNFIEGAQLVIHNASFDVSFLDAELSYLNLQTIDKGMVIDTLAIARRKHPMASNSLDALCKRYRVDNTRRTKHGALLDAELLAEVYVELLGGRQTALNLASNVRSMSQANAATEMSQTTRSRAARPSPLPERLTETERQSHAAFVERLGASSLWKQLESKA